MLPKSLAGEKVRLDLYLLLMRHQRLLQSNPHHQREMPHDRSERYDSEEMMFVLVVKVPGTSMSQGTRKLGIDVVAKLEYL